MPLTITYNNDKIYNSIKVENTDAGSYYKYVTSQSLYFNAGVEYEISYRMYAESTSSKPLDLYITSSGTDGFPKTNRFGYLIDVVNIDLNTFTEKRHLVTPLYNSTASIELLLKYGTYYISEFKVKPYQTNNFSLGEMDLIIPSPPVTRNEPLSITPVYIARNGKPVGYTDVTLVDAGQQFDFTRYTIISGSNLVISHDDNLIEGSLFVGKNLRTGVEISGFDNAMIRSVGYAGYSNALNFGWPGFLLYSGSVLPGSGENYRGVGLELHSGTASGSLRYRVDDSGSFLEITGSIYATSGYFSGIVSASIGQLGGWLINSSSIYSTNNGKGIRLDSSTPSIQFFSASTTWVSMQANTTKIKTYYGVTQSLDGIYFNVGNKDATNTQGASIIYNFGYETSSIESASIERGDFVILDARNIIFNAVSGTQLNSNVLVTSPMTVNGDFTKGFDGRIINQWKSIYTPYTSSATPSNFTTNFHSSIQSLGTQSVWSTGIHSNTAIFGVNNNYMGSQGTPPQFQAPGIDFIIKDIINSGITGLNNRGIRSGIKVGVYGICLGYGTTLGETINGYYGASAAILGDAAPGTTGKSGVFRWGRFYIGDPWNDYSGSKRIVFFADGSPNFNGQDNPNFGRVGINTYTPQYALHVTGQNAHGEVPASLGIIYASDDIIAFSDIRKKTNIIQISGSLGLIRSLTGVRFNKVNGTENTTTNTRPVIKGERTKIGLIAQDVEKILPEVVYTDDAGYKSIGYANIVALLIEGIKEQQIQIDELKEEIKKLKG